MIRHTLIITDAYYDDSEADNDLLIRPGDDDNHVIITPWPGNSNGVDIRLSRDEVGAILALMPSEGEAQ